MARETVNIYQPDNLLKKGYVFIFRDIYKEIRQNRWLTWQIFKRDFLALYKQSFIGIFWVFFVPFIGVATFIILNRAGILNYGEIDVPYPLYAVAGIACWQLFSCGLTFGSGSLVRAGSMVVKINFSRKSLVLASLGQAVISFVVQMALVSLLFGYYRIMPAASALFVIPAVVPLFCFTLGLSFILAILNGIMRDIGNTVSVLTSFLMLLTPVLYIKPEDGFLAELSRYNPLYYLIQGPRDLLFFGRIIEVKGFAVSSVIAVAVLFICLFVFHLAEARIAERI